MIYIAQQVYCTDTCTSCKKVIGVESVEEAVESAKENAALNGLDNCECITGVVLKMIDTIKEKPDLIVLDPPRDGIHPKALERIIDYGVNKLVYISCKYTNLARDLVMLRERGYKVVRFVRWICFRRQCMWR